MSAFKVWDYDDLEPLLREQFNLNYEYDKRRSQDGALQDASYVFSPRAFHSVIITPVFSFLNHSRYADVIDHS